MEWTTILVLTRFFDGRRRGRGPVRADARFHLPRGQEPRPASDPARLRSVTAVVMLLVAALMVITYVAWRSLWLPRTFGY